MLTVIKSEADYDRTLEELEELIVLDPELGTPEGDRLELLTLLVQDYERRTCSLSKPDPIEAILFRMEQQNLTPRDLIPFIGSRSKVSEVLSRKRPLTLSMIRALHEGLGIPANVLLTESTSVDREYDTIQWERYPIKEMTKRGWFQAGRSDRTDPPEILLRNFLSAAGSPATVQALYRKTENIRSGRKVDEFALHAWTVRVLQRAQQNPPEVAFTPGTVDKEFIQELARLSWSDRGPLLAQEYLSKHGISLVIEPHLPGTLLDGAAIMVNADHPVIGLTLRYDRIDNFWFTLAHECAHLALHADGNTTQFFDDLDVEAGDPREIEADALAGEALIPTKAWEDSAASTLPSQQAAEALARELKIHPAIVAGRIRHTSKAYRKLNNLVGHKQVRRCFADINWGRED